MTRHSEGLEGIFRHPDMAFHGITRHNKANHKQRINILKTLMQCTKSKVWEGMKLHRKMYDKAWQQVARNEKARQSMKICQCYIMASHHGWLLCQDMVRKGESW